MVTKRFPMQISASTYKLLKNHSAQTRVPMSTTLDMCVKDWMETVGAARLEAMAEQEMKGRGKLLTFPSAKSANA